MCYLFPPCHLDAKSLHDRFRHKHRTELNRIQDRQATLDGLIARSDLLVSKLHKLRGKESDSRVLLKELPSSYQTLKKEIEHKARLLAALDKHVIGPLALSAREDTSDEKDKLISAIETTLNDGQRDDGEVFIASPITNGTADGTALLQDGDRLLVDQVELPEAGVQFENRDELQGAVAVEADECMEIDPKVKESPKRVQHEMEVETEMAREGQKAEADEQGTELPSLSAPSAAANSLAQEVDVSSVDAETTGTAMEIDNAEARSPIVDVKKAVVDREAPATELATFSTKANAEASELKTTLDAESVQTNTSPVDVNEVNAEPEAPNAEVKTESTERQSAGIQSTVAEVEGPVPEVGNLQKNAVEALPVSNYSNSPDIVTQQAEESAVQQESRNENTSEDAECSAEAIAPGTDHRVEEATSTEGNIEVEQKVCETPEVSPASDGVTSPLGLEPPISTHNVPAVVSGQGRRRSSLHEHDSEKLGEDSPPPSKVRKLSVDTIHQASSEAPVGEGSLHAGPLPAEAHEDMPRTTSEDMPMATSEAETDRVGEWQQQVDSAQGKGKNASTPGSEQGIASPMDSSGINVDETLVEAVSQNPEKQEEESVDEGSVVDNSMVLPIAKSPTEETKSSLEEAKSPVTSFAIPTASEDSSVQDSGPAAGTVVGPQPVSTPTYSGRKRSKSADSPVSGGESAVGAKRRHSASSDINVKSPVDSNVPLEDTFKVPLEEEVHDTIGQSGHEAEMDISGSQPPLEKVAEKVEGNQSPNAEAFSPISPSESATSLAAEDDVNKTDDVTSSVQKDSLNTNEVRSERVKDGGDDVLSLAPMPPEEPVDHSPVESTDAALLSEMYTEVDRVLSPIMEEGSQDLLDLSLEQKHAPQTNSPADLGNSNDHVVSSVEGESSEEEKGLELGSKYSEQQLVDDTTAQRFQQSHSLETREERSLEPTKEFSPIPSEDEPVPPGTEGDAMDEVEYEPYRMLSPRRRTRSGSTAHSEGPAEAQMDTSASEEAAGTEHQELAMDYGTHKCTTTEDVLRDEVDNGTAVDEMETEEHAADLLQLRAEGHLPASEERSSASGDHSDASNMQATATGEDNAEDTAEELQQGLDSNTVTSLANVAEIPSTSVQCDAASSEPLTPATELVGSPKEAVQFQTEPVTPPGETIASLTEPITPPKELDASLAEPSTSPVSLSKGPITSPLHSPEQAVISLKEPISSPVSSPKEPTLPPVPSPKEPVIPPVSSPMEPGTSLQEPVTSPQEPATSPQQLVTSPQEPVTSPQEPVTSPQEPVTSPQEPVTSPQEPVTSPQEPVTSPQEPVTSPQEPVTSPLEPATCATEHTDAPEDAFTTHAEPDTSSSASEHAASHLQTPPGDVPMEGEDQTQYEDFDASESEVKDDSQPTVDVSPLEEGLLDDLLDETGQVTSGSGEEAYQLHPADDSLLDDDGSVDGQSAEPATDGERVEEESNQDAGQRQQGADYEEMEEKAKPLAADESGAKDASEREESKCAIEGEESVDFRYSLNTSDPSTSEQLHQEEEVVGSAMEAHGQYSGIPVAQEPEEAIPDKPVHKEVGETSEKSVIRGLVAYGDSGSSSEDENTEEAASSSAYAASAVGVQPETGEQLHEGSHGNQSQEAERPPSSTGEAVQQNREGSPSDAGNGEEEMDTSTVREEDCSEEMDLT